MYANHQTGPLALGHRRKPRRIQPIGVGHRHMVDPAAVVGTRSPLLVLDQVVAYLPCRVEPDFAVSCEVALVAAEPPLRRGNVNRLLEGVEPRWGPFGLLGLDPEVEVVAAEAAVGADLRADGQGEGALAGEHPGRAAAAH